MANLMDYLDWRGDLPFSAYPFNEVDNVIFSQLVYLEFENVVPCLGSDAEITVEAAAIGLRLALGGAPQESEPQLIKDAFAMLQKMALQPRFKGLRLSRYVNTIDLQQEVQFSALKIRLDAQTVYLSFSGTDSTVVGWKENLNMSYLPFTPGQKMAVSYLSAALSNESRVYLGGHSKGGNLAVYAAVYAPEALQDRLLAVYSNDGPGFSAAMLQEPAYAAMLPKICRIVPQDSIIGMLLEHLEQPEIVCSEASGIWQHHAFHWQVMRDGFLRAEQRSAESLIKEAAIKEWVAELDLPRRKEFVTSFFQILADANITNMDTLHQLTPQNLTDLVHAAQSLTPAQREVLETTLQRLSSIYAAKEGQQIPWLNPKKPEAELSPAQKNAELLHNSVQAALAKLEAASAGCGVALDKELAEARTKLAALVQAAER